MCIYIYILVHRHIYIYISIFHLIPMYSHDEMMILSCSCSMFRQIRTVPQGSLISSWTHLLPWGTPGNGHGGHWGMRRKRCLAADTSPTSSLLVLTDTRHLGKGMRFVLLTSTPLPWWNQIAPCAMEALGIQWSWIQYDPMKSTISLKILVHSL